MRIAEKSGLLEAMEQRMQPVLNFLFPEIPGNHPSRKSIATNLLANVLGLGWAATPAGPVSYTHLVGEAGGFQFFQVEDFAVDVVAETAAGAGEAGDDAGEFDVYEFIAEWLSLIHI